MRLGILIGLGGGLASALLFYSAAHGSPLLSTLLLLLTPLPSLLAGLGWGSLPAAAGAIAGSLVMAIAASVPFSAGYFLALGLPAALVAHLAYLSRPDPHDPSQREWYPAGRLIAGLALYGGALPVLVLPLIGGSYEMLRPPMGEFFRRLAMRFPELGLQPVSDQEIHGAAELAVALLPGLLAGYWLAIFAFNLYLAGRIARASGRLGRDWPDISALSYPRGFPLLFALALAALLVPGTSRIAGASFTGALLLAYLLAGLALMHFIARSRAPWILWFVYAALLLFEPYTAAVLTLAGLLEPLLGLRRRYGPSPPST